MAGKKLIWSARARNDLNAIVRFYRKRNGNNEYGRKLRQEFRLAQKRVEQNELIGERIGETDVRFVVVLHAYQLFYQMGERQNDVITVWDTRRNPADLKVDGD